MISNDLQSTPLDCRLFSSVLTAVVPTASHATLGQVKLAEPEILQLSRNAWVPNNDRLPVLIYRGALDTSGPDAPARVEEILRRNGWPVQWHDKIYDFHHYHSTTHEMLGIAAGQVRVVLGGPAGFELTLSAGDAAVLPVGTGHCQLQSSPDSLVVGAYSHSQSRDICRSAPSRAERERMRTLPFPPSDPITGVGGALTKWWCPPVSDAA